MSILQLNGHLRGWKNLFLIEGAIMIVFGAIAILLPPIAGLAVVILLGWLLMGSGVLGLVTTFLNRAAPGFWWSLLSAIITCIAGILLFAWPLGGMISLSVALAAFLSLDGIIAIGLALEHRRRLTLKWLWLLVNGVVDIVFAALIVLWLPASAFWALGLFIGADMLISGITSVGLALDLGKEAVS